MPGGGLHGCQLLVLHAAENVVDAKARSVQHLHHQLLHLDAALGRRLAKSFDRGVVEDDLDQLVGVVEGSRASVHLNTF